MPTTKNSRHFYEKKIKELEARLERANARILELDSMEHNARQVLGKLYDWLAEFAKSGASSPNAAYGLAMFRGFVWNRK